MTDHFFMGIPVSGDIDQRSGRPQQLGIEEFTPLFTAVLADPTVRKFGWQQYTPYFNDGDPCEFSASSFWVLLDDNVSDDGKLILAGTPYGWIAGTGVAVDDADNDDLSQALSFEYDNRAVGGYRKTYDHAARVWTNHEYTGPDQARYDRLEAFSDALEGGQFNDLLLEKFSDHARVTVTAQGITVETYQHD